MKVPVTGDVPDTPALSTLERQVLEVALAADELAALREQLAGVEVVSRTYSGVGFLTRFRVPASAPAAPVKVAPAPVLGSHAQLADGAEFLVALRDGRLQSLEAYCYEGLWPADETGFRLAGRA
jgi:hypothetical protein